MIYGAPGVGKLTTAKALAGLTGFKVFHNHLSFDLARAIFEFPTPAFARLFGYASPEDDPFVERMIQVVERFGGELGFARLFCDTVTHEQRILAEERERFGKITSVAKLRDALARWNFTRTIPARETFEIDNSNLAADVVARRIVARFSLPVA